MARPHVTLWIAPTARPDADVPTAPAGLWRIEIDNSAGAAAVAPIDAWIQRDDTAPGYPGVAGNRISMIPTICAMTTAGGRSRWTAARAASGAKGC